MLGTCIHVLVYMYIHLYMHMSMCAHMFQVEADKLEFTEVVASITPSDLYLPDLTPISPLRQEQHMCMHVVMCVFNYAVYNTM